MMDQLLFALIDKCEIVVHLDATGWQLSAKGGLGVTLVFVIILLLMARKWR